MLGFGIDLSLSQLDDYAKVQSRTTRGEEGLRERRRFQAYKSMWWDSAYVREEWSKLWGKQPGYAAQQSLTSDLEYITFDDLLTLENAEARDYEPAKVAAHWYAVRRQMIGASLRVGRRGADPSSSWAACDEYSCASMKCA